MFGTFQIIFYNSNNTQTSIWRITWELQLTYTCTRFGLPRFVSNWERLTTCSKRSRIGEFGTSLFSNGFLVALLVRITHFVSFPVTRRFILSPLQISWKIATVDEGLSIPSNLAKHERIALWTSHSSKWPYFSRKILHAAVFLCPLLNSVSSGHYLLQCTESIGTLIGSSGA